MRKINLICLPFAGASKHSYRGFQKVIPNGINLVNVELPGRGARFGEKLYTSINDMVEDIYIQIKDYIHLPYAIYGHSMGTLLAYELIMTLKRKLNSSPLHLFVSGRGGPSVRYDQTPPRYLLPFNKFISKLKEMGGSPDDILEDQELMNFFEPIIRADFEAVETYEFNPTTPMDVSITCMLGVNEKTTYQQGMEWQKVSALPIELLQYPGKHFFIFEFEKEIMEHISRKLNQAHYNKC